MGKPGIKAAQGERSTFGRLAELLGFSQRDAGPAVTPGDSAPTAPKASRPEDELGVGGVDWGRRSLYRDPYRH